MNCLNCTTEYKGQFCPSCGQKSKTRRLTVFSVVQDFLNALSDSDKGFLRTVIDLSQNPGAMLRDYIAGKRQRYLSAGKYTFFLVIVFTVHLSYLENHFGWFQRLTQLIETIEIKNPAPEKPANSQADKKKRKSDMSGVGVFKSQQDDDMININMTLWGKSVNRRVHKHQAFRFLKDLLPHYHRTLFDYLKFLLILWVPIFAFFSLIIFYKSPYNFAEHITINTYIYAHILLVYVGLSPLYWLTPQLSGTTLMVSTTASFFFLCYSYMQVFNQRRYRLVKTFIALTASFTTYMVTLSVLVTCLATYIALDNIDAL